MVIVKNKCKNAGNPGFPDCQQWFTTTHCGMKYCPMCKTQEEREKERVQNRKKYERLRADMQSIIYETEGMYMLRR